MEGEEMMNILPQGCAVDTYFALRLLFIEKIALPPLLERGQISLPPLRDLSRVFSVFKRPHRIHIRNQTLRLCHREIRIKMMQCANQLYSQFRRIERRSVRHRKRDPRK